MPPRMAAETAENHLYLMERTELETIETGADLPGEDIRDQFAAGGVGVDEVRRNKPGLGGVPTRHGSFPTHGRERVKETAVRLHRNTALDGHDARDGWHGGNLAGPGPVAAVHRAHHQNGGARNGGANSANGFPQFLLVPVVHRWF